MVSTYQRLKSQRDAGEISGFTLIELLIVIVVLGILAAVVIFALGGITGKSAVAACQADGATISTAMAAMAAQTTTTQTGGPTPTDASSLVTGVTLPGDATVTKWLQSWPSNLPHYSFKIVAGVLDVAIAPVGAVVNATSTFAAYTGPGTCVGVG